MMGLMGTVVTHEICDVIITNILMLNTELRFALDGHVFPLIKSSAHCFEAVYVLLWMCNLVSKFVKCRVIVTK